MSDSTKASTLRIVLCANNRYSTGLLVCLLSALRSIGHNTRVEVHVLDAGLSESIRRQIIECVGTFPNAEARFISPPGGIFDAIRHQRYHKSVYFRLALGEMLDAREILYLDADVLVFNSLTPLQAIRNSGNAPVIAVADRETHAVKDDCPIAAADFDGLRINRYFNSGVLGLSLDWMRREQVCDRALSLLQNPKYSIRFPDQTALNLLAGDSWVDPGAEWNTPAWVFDQQPDNQLPGILHYTNSAPWLQRHYRPSQALFERVAHELGVALPWPEKGLRRTIPAALAKWLLAPARVAWHGLRGLRAARQGDPKKATGERHIMRHWWHYFAGGPARVLRYHRRIRQIRHPQFKVFSP